MNHGGVKLYRVFIHQRNVGVNNVVNLPFV